VNGVERNALYREATSTHFERTSNINRIWLKTRLKICCRLLQSSVSREPWNSRLRQGTVPVLNKVRGNWDPSTTAQVQNFATFWDQSPKPIKPRLLNQIFGTVFGKTTSVALTNQLCLESQFGNVFLAQRAALKSSHRSSLDQSQVRTCFLL